MESNTRWHLVTQGAADTPRVVAGEMIVGRGRDADLRIVEGFVSRRHARLWTESDVLMVEDLNSANGTFVNGERVTAASRLLAGDRVTFDVFEFRVEAVSAARDPDATEVEGTLDSMAEDTTGAPRLQGPGQSPSAEGRAQGKPEDAWISSAEDAYGADHPRLAETDASVDEAIGDGIGIAADHAAPAAIDGGPEAPDAASPPSSSTMTLPAQKAPAASPAPQMHRNSPGLLGLSGPMKKHLFQLMEGRVLLGRDAGCDIVLAHKRAAPRQLEIMVEGGRSRATALSEAQDTLLNGEPVTEADLLPGDLLTLGGSEFRYDRFRVLSELVEADTGPPPWAWMVVGFLAAGALLLLAYLFVL